LSSPEIAPASSCPQNPGPTDILSWGFALPRRLRGELVSPYWFGDSSTPLASCMFVNTPRWASRSSQLSWRPRRFNTSRRSALGVTTPPEYDHCRRPRGVQAHRVSASHEVCGSFSTIHLASPLNPGVPPPVRSVCRVSHPRDGLLLARLPGLVSCQSAHGVPTLQSVPLVRSCSVSRRPVPSCRCALPSNAPRPLRVKKRASFPATRHSSQVRDPNCRPFTALHVVFEDTLDFKALLPGTSPLRVRRPLSYPSTRCSPGLSPPRGYPLAAAHRCWHQRTSLEP